MRGRLSVLCAGVLAVCLGGMAGRASGALIVDDFESYAAGQVIANSASSTPWLRFGNSIADNLTATSNAARVISGTRSGSIPFTWATATNATVRRNYGVATDLSAFDLAQIDVKSLNLSTTAMVKLSLTDGVTTYASTAGQGLTGVAQTFSFPIDGTSMTLTGGTTPLATVMKNITAIGVRVENAVGQVNETIILDNFTLTNAPPVPEPGVVGGVVGVGVVVGRRRRRKA